MPFGQFFPETRVKDGLTQIDIAATEVTIPINIVANEVTLPVSITAAAVTIPIKIIAQEVAVDISIHAQTVGVYLQPEWAAKIGIDVCLSCFNFAVPRGDFSEGYFEVPTGKTLFLSSIHAYSYASQAADGDLPHAFEVQLQSGLLGYVIDFGGNTGASVTLPRPQRFDSEDYLLYQVWNWANHDCNLGLWMLGYFI